MWASSISFLYGIGVLQTPPLKFLTLMIDFDVFPSCRERFASAEAAHHRNDLVDDLPGVGVLCAAHTANQLQSGVVLDVALAERSLLPELPSSVYHYISLCSCTGIPVCNWILSWTDRTVSCVLAWITIVFPSEIILMKNCNRDED
jgi:hypothetical protein